MRPSNHRNPLLPDIVAFKDYREFLAAVFDLKKIQNKKFSYEYWSQKIPATKSYLKLLIGKKRHTSQDRLWKLANLFELTDFERQYLIFLFHKNTAINREVSKYYEDILTSFKDRAQLLSQTGIELPPTNLPTDSHMIYKSWLHMALCSLVRLSDFKEDASWIQKKLSDPTLTQNSILEAWKELVSAGAIKRKNEGYEDRRHVAFDNQLTDPNNFNVVRPVLAKAYEVCENASRYRSFTFQTLNVALSKEEGFQLVNMYQKLFKDINDLQMQSKNPEYVFLISNNFFNVTPREPQD